MKVICHSADLGHLVWILPKDIAEKIGKMQKILTTSQLKKIELYFETVIKELTIALRMRKEQAQDAVRLITDINRDLADHIAGWVEDGTEDSTLH